MKEKERIDNDTTLDKKRKQNLKKKLRKKLKKAAIKMNNESIIETEDNTDLSGELACAGGACEIDIDLSTITEKEETTNQ